MTSKVAAMSILIALLTALGLARADDSDALRQTAPTYLTVEDARVHLAAAQLAADARGVPAELLLSIAWHESRYVADARTREPGDRWSCGVMTPEPHAGECRPEELTVLGGYLAGATHLRVWLDACGGDVACAERGYAGGYHPSDRARTAAQVFADRAALIRTEMQRAKRRTT